MARWGTHQNFHLSLSVSFLAPPWWAATTAGPAPRMPRSSSPPRCPRSTSAPSPSRAKTPARPTTSSRRFSRPWPGQAHGGGRRADAGVRIRPRSRWTTAGTSARSEWKYTVSAQLKKSGDKWLTVWNPASWCRSWRTAKSSAAPPSLPSGPPSWVPATPRWSPTARWSTSGSTSPSSAAADPADSATKLAQLVGVDPAAYATAGRGGRSRGVRCGHHPARRRPGPSPTSRSQRFPAAGPSRTRCRSLPPAPSPGPCSAQPPRPAPNRSKSRAGR